MAAFRIPLIYLNTLLKPHASQGETGKKKNKIFHKYPAMQSQVATVKQRKAKTHSIDSPGLSAIRIFQPQKATRKGIAYLATLQMS